MIYPQMLLDLHGELIVDLFAGGGGASCGIEMATGRQVDVAINHDAPAVAMHALNHPQTKHHVCDVFEVDPRAVTEGRRIGLLWASPDCTFHSKARGGKPIRSKERKRRALAWVVTRWAGQVRPRVIMLENVEEFVQWGPLVGPKHAQRPCRQRKGRTFRTWKRSLLRLGYQVEHRELRACDYGAPTIRKRLFLIARCDGEPIVWPEASHGPGRKRPWRTAAECIDWSIPMLSIFATREEARAWGKKHGQSPPKRPLAKATNRRIARGVMRFVVNNPEPYIVDVAHGENCSTGAKRWGAGIRSLNQPASSVLGSGNPAIVSPTVVPLTHHGERRSHPIDEPVPTVTGAQRGELALTAPLLVPNNTNNAPQSVEDPMSTITGGGRMILTAAGIVPRYGERDGQDPRVRSIKEPYPTVVTTGNGGSLVGAFLAKHYGDTGQRPGSDLAEPVSTVTASDHNALVAAHIQRDFGTSVGHPADRPIGTITSDFGGHAGLVASFLQAYYGTGNQQDPREPLFTIPTVDRFGLVTVDVRGEPYVLADIAMRMLQPRELYRAQGFPDSYVIDRGADGRRLTKTEQVRMCGNSVCPPIAAALARANVPEMIVSDAARRIA